MLLYSFAERWGKMADLDKEIRRLAGEIRAIEEMVVAVYGVSPVTGTIAAHAGSRLHRTLSAVLGAVRRTLAPMFGRHQQRGLAVRSPQPD